ncbi:MAG: DUF305 domain-containing protein [Microbacteriaceae bacterium]
MTTGEPDTTVDEGTARSGSTRAVVAAIVVTVLVVAGAFFLGRVTASGSETFPTTESSAAGFLRDMQVHHAQGVEMAMIVRDNTDAEDVRLLAYDIATSQSNQAGQMYALLFAWDLPQFGRDASMTWMTRPALDGSGHEHEGAAHVPGEPMPGLATREQMEQLRDSEGLEAERLFLELMIAHHRGGVEMAEAVDVRTENSKVLTLANSMLLAQSAEIDAMTEMLAERE